MVAVFKALTNEYMATEYHCFLHSKYLEMLTFTSGQQVRQINTTSLKIKLSPSCAKHLHSSKNIIFETIHVNPPSQGISFT